MWVHCKQSRDLMRQPGFAEQGLGGDLPQPLKEAKLRLRRLLLTTHRSTPEHTRGEIVQISRARDAGEIAPQYHGFSAPGAGTMGCCSNRSRSGKFPSLWRLHAPAQVSPRLLKRCSQSEHNKYVFTCAASYIVTSGFIITGPTAFPSTVARELLQSARGR
jgi:hypothetical protein